MWHTFEIGFHLSFQKLIYKIKIMDLNHVCRLCWCRDSRDEPLELSEDERNELMKKESSRLLKTGHRVSYSPRKEKALKIYLDGGPMRDPGQDWATHKPLWAVLIAWLLRRNLQASGLWHNSDLKWSSIVRSVFSQLVLEAPLLSRTLVVYYSVMYCKV